MNDILIGNLKRQLEVAEAFMLAIPASDPKAIRAALRHCDEIDARLMAAKRTARTERAIERQALRSYADAV